MSHIEMLTIDQHIDAPTAKECEYFRNLGLETDTLGRPLHPWRESLTTLEEGKGFYWKWGPNYTVDPIVISNDDEPKILLVRRGDNGKWALPGGFIDDGEHPSVAGLREVDEETGLRLEACEPILCYQGPVQDQRSRLHAWSDTTALLWRHASSESVHGGDDAIDAQWVRLRDIATLGELHGSHAALIDMAIRNHGSLREQLEYYGETSEITHPKGGHMGYERLVASFPNGSRVFIKRHNIQKFTDKIRAEHSKRYLRKEHHVYSQLRGASPHLPRRTELISDHTLLLEAYDPRDDWHWRAPQDDDMRQRYIRDILDALHSISSLSYAPFDEIKPSYQTLLDEGWRAFPVDRDKIINRLRQSHVTGAYELAQNLDKLYRRANMLSTPALDTFAHYDIRQSNIAWHPDQGVRIVDWSWADLAPKGMDTTSFLIDIAKAGYDVDNFIENFDVDHALVLIGFWLGHSVWPTPTEDQTVREHQIGSAVAAYQLLQRLSK